MNMQSEQCDLREQKMMRVKMRVKAILSPGSLVNQWVHSIERLPPKRQAVGSNPAGCANDLTRLYIFE